MKQTIFYLEGRGGMYLFHFFIFNLGGLYHILNKQYNVRGENGTSVLMNDTSKHVPEPTTVIQFPIKIHMQDVLPFQREIFEIIKDKFELVEDLSKYEDYEIVSIYGFKNTDGLPLTILNFLRNLILDHMPKFEMVKGKRVFITRKNSEGQHSGTLKRFIMNEAEIMQKLQPHGFEYIQLEDLSTFEKIRLFAEAEVIMSSHTGAFTFCLFSNEKTKVIEILNNGTLGFPHGHFAEICNTLGIPYYRYSNINEDYNGNFILEFDPFECFLKSIL